MVFDTGVLLEWVKGTKHALELKQKVESGAISPHTTDMNLFELSYLVCRREGWKKATAVTGSFRQSGYFRIHEAREFLDPAAEMKCGRAISVVDCITIAAGETLGIPVLFARRERELGAAVKELPFKTELVFLPELEHLVGAALPR